MTVATRAWDAVVDGIVEECRGVRTFRLSVPDALSFRPGQSVSLAFPDEPSVKRWYSIASSPLERGFIEVTASLVARVTERLFALKGGETLQVSGPHGAWVYEDSARAAVLASGGTGLAPFRSMLRYALGKGLPVRLALAHSARTPEDLAYARELEDFARRGVSLHLTMTRPAESSRRWEGPVGRLDAARLVELAGGSEEARYYLCGPSPMVADLEAGLLAAGVGAGRISRERWGK